METITDAGGTATREAPISNNYVTFTKEEIATAEKTFTAEDLEGKTFDQITEIILLAAMFNRMKTEKLYGAVITDWELVI